MRAPFDRGFDGSRRFVKSRAQSIVDTQIGYPGFEDFQSDRPPRPTWAEYRTPIPTPENYELAKRNGLNE
jgi:hypothetical protein